MQMNLGIISISSNKHYPSHPGVREEDVFIREIHFLLLDKAIPLSAVSYLLSVQNNLYAKVGIFMAYLEMAYSDSLQLRNICGN